MTPISAFSVSVAVGGEPMDAGEVSWSSSVAARDLVLTLLWGGVKAEATAVESSSGGAGPGGGEGMANQDAMGSGTGSVDRASPTEPAPGGGVSGVPIASAAGPSSQSDDAWVWFSFGLGALGLVVGGILLARREPNGLPEVELARAPEPALFGGGSPSVHQGLSLWQVDWSDREAFVSGLVGALAPHHRVLLVQPSSSVVPSVLGGPVYLCHDTNLRRVESHLDDILELPGLPLVLVFVEADPSTPRLAALAELLAADLGGMVVVANPPADAGPLVRVTVRGDGARLDVDGESIELEYGRCGYAPLA
jgi:hypothetical protein